MPTAIEKQSTVTSFPPAIELSQASASIIQTQNSQPSLLTIEGWTAVKDQFVADAKDTLSQIKKVYNNLEAEAHPSQKQVKVEEQQAEGLTRSDTWFQPGIATYGLIHGGKVLLSGFVIAIGLPFGFGTRHPSLLGEDKPKK